MAESDYSILGKGSSMTREVEMCEYQLTHCIIEMETGGSIDREKLPEVTLTSVDSADHSLSRRNSYSPHWLGEVGYHYKQTHIHTLYG